MKQLFRAVLLATVIFLLTVPAMAAEAPQENMQPNGIVEYMDLSQPVQVRMLTEGEWEDGWTCYKDQLTGYARSAYEVLESAFASDSVPLVTLQFSDSSTRNTWWLDRVISIEQYGDAEKQAARQACLAFTYDHPEYFWLRYDIGFGYMTEGSTTWLRLGFIAQPTCDTREKRDALQTQIDPVIKQLLADTSAMSDIEKVAYFDSWLAENNTYNDEAADTDDYIDTDDTPWNIVGALLEDHSPVCEGYAKTLQLLCKKSDIPCVPLSGSNHMWTAVQLDGQWYFCDPTWNDSSYSGTSNRVYFLKKAASAHQPDMDFITPQLADQDYLDWTRTKNVSDGIFGGSTFTGDQVYWVGLYGTGGRMIAVRPCAIFDWTGSTKAWAAPKFTADELAGAVTAKLFALNDWMPTSAAQPLGGAAG